MPLIRKDRAGSDSLGHSWPKDGSVVNMPHEEAEELLAIPDGGFTLAPPDAEDSPKPSPDDDTEDDPEQPNPEFAEVDPQAPAAEPEDKPATKKAAARKATARKPVEE